MKAKPRTLNSGSLRTILETAKHDTRLLGEIQQHLLSRDDEPRDQKFLHPSEIAKTDWCPRQSYYRIAGFPERKNSERSYVLENIFAEGHEVHAKYQGYIHQMGKLRGRWECLGCGSRWSATSPPECPACHCTALKYREVNLHNDEYLITGHADGDYAEGNEDVADDPLIEIKTIGIGTLRFENPGLLANHTHRIQMGEDEKTFIDYDAIWRDIKRPFPSHIRQAMIYLFLKGRKTMIFIYECKWNQRTKEFVIRFRPEVIEDLLDTCLDVKHALKIQKTPSRPTWADVECKTCTTCPFQQTCWNLEPSPGELHGKRGTRADGDRRNGEGTSGEGRPRSSGGASVLAAEAAAPTRRVVRRRADAALRRPDPVD